MILAYFLISIILDAAPAYSGRTLRLIEVNDEILTSLLSDHDSSRLSKLTLKGSKDKSDAVLCTRDKTFTLKKVETSNSVFLVPPSSSQSFWISAKSADYFEVYLYKMYIYILNNE
jgi:hypothetical protein